MKMYKKTMLPSQGFWDESEIASWCHPNSGRKAPFGLLWYGEGAVGVSAPAPPLSFVQTGRGALSAASLSVGR